MSGLSNKLFPFSVVSNKLRASNLFKTTGSVSVLPAVSGTPTFKILAAPAIDASKLSVSKSDAPLGGAILKGLKTPVFSIVKKYV